MTKENETTNDNVLQQAVLFLECIGDTTTFRTFAPTTSVENNDDKEKEETTPQQKLQCIQTSTEPLLTYLSSSNQKSLLSKQDVAFIMLPYSITQLLRHANSSSSSATPEDTKDIQTIELAWTILHHCLAYLLNDDTNEQNGGGTNSNSSNNNNNISNMLSQ
eukprot:12937675-Ditylum_brightwellii.AAC.1